MRKKLTIILCVVATLFAAASIYGGNYFYNLALGVNEKTFLDNDDALSKADADETFDYDAYKKKQTLWREKHHAKDVFIRSEDDLRLRGIFIKGKNNTKKTVILAHGYTGESEEMTKYAQYYHDTYGFNVLMPDARGHGQSEGGYIGMGWPERRDYVQWINYIINTIGADSEIALHGVSMGGATVMMTSGEQLPKQVKFIVEDCGYSDVKTLFEYHLTRLFHLPTFPLIPVTSAITKMRAGYTFGEASSINQVKKATVPMIFIHGEEDDFVPFEMVYDVYEAANTKDKVLLTIPGAQHANAFDVADKSNDTSIRDAIDKYVHKYMSTKNA